MTNKEKVFGLVLNYCRNLDWVRDSSSSYLDYECNLGEYKVRVVGVRSGNYLQIMRSCTDYRLYEEKDYPDVNEILESAIRHCREKDDEDFFADVLAKFESAIDEQGM